MNEIAKLIQAAEAAGDLLGRIPAFGDSIGAAVSKAQLGTVLNQLEQALAAVNPERPTKPTNCNPCGSGGYMTDSRGNYRENFYTP